MVTAARAFAVMVHELLVRRGQGWFPFASSKVFRANWLLELWRTRRNGRLFFVVVAGGRRSCSPPPFVILTTFHSS